MTPVLHVIPSVAARDGGPSAAVAGMCRALAALGVPVLVAATDADGAGHLDVPLDEPVDYAGMRVRFFRCQWSEKWKYSAPLGRWLQRNVASHAVVHVHAVFSYASIAAGAACRRAGVPYVVRPLGTIDPWSLAHHRARKRTLLRFGAGTLLRGAARVHYTSDEEQRRAERALPDLPPGVVIPLGVPDDLFLDSHEARPARDASIVTMSRLDRKKGIELVIQAFHAVCDRHPAGRLIVAGDGDRGYADELRALAARGPGAPRIEFRGWVDAAARRELLGRARVFVLASSQENFGLAMVEAMAAGAPVIVAETVDLAGRIERHQAGWVTPRSADGVARALDACLSNSADADQKGRRARALAEDYRWGAIGVRLSELYRDVRADAPSTHEAAAPVRAAGRT